MGAESLREQAHAALAAWLANEFDKAVWDVIAPKIVHFEVTYESYDNRHRNFD